MLLEITKVLLCPNHYLFKMGLKPAMSSGPLQTSLAIKLLVLYPAWPPIPSLAQNWSSILPLSPTCQVDYFPREFCID